MNFFAVSYSKPALDTRHHYFIFRDDDSLWKGNIDGAWTFWRRLKNIIYHITSLFCLSVSSLVILNTYVCSKSKPLKFIYSEKVTKFWKISIVDLTVHRTNLRRRFRKNLGLSQYAYKNFTSSSLPTHFFWDCVKNNLVSRKSCCRMSDLEPKTEMRLPNHKTG